ncbi:hypothetical protein [Dyella silvatica]|uniref:hypothetical protein n=1 Tax=Dyella silvatica TaxID=2992128 RepID=UPI0022534EC6|nr:hypothetical protein [Dyella silvatica]
MHDFAWVDDHQAIASDGLAMALVGQVERGVVACCYAAGELALRPQLSAAVTTRRGGICHAIRRTDVRTSSRNLHAPRLRAPAHVFAAWVGGFRSLAFSYEWGMFSRHILRESDVIDKPCPRHCLGTMAALRALYGFFHQ